MTLDQFLRQYALLNKELKVHGPSSELYVRAVELRVKSPIETFDDVEKFRKTKEKKC